MGVPVAANRSEGDLKPDAKGEEGTNTDVTNAKGDGTTSGTKRGKFVSSQRYKYEGETLRLV